MDLAIYSKIYFLIFYNKKIKKDLISIDDDKLLYKIKYKKYTYYLYVYLGCGDGVNQAELVDYRNSNTKTRQFMNTNFLFMLK